MQLRLWMLLGLSVCLGLVLTSVGGAQRSDPRPAQVNANWQPAEIADAQDRGYAKLVGQIGGPTNGVVVRGDLAYLAVGPRVVVLDVSEPARPTLVGRTAVLPGVVEDIAVAGPYAYVTTGDAGLRVVDISDPAAPQVVGFYDTPDFAERLFVVGHYAFVIAGSWEFYPQSRLRVIDVSDSTSPMEVADEYLLRYSGSIYVTGDPSTDLGPHYAFVTDLYNGVTIIDVSVPTEPIRIGIYEIAGGTTDVHVVGDPASGSQRAYAYVTTRETGLKALDVSNPATPMEVDTYAPPGGFPLRIHVAGHNAYVMWEICDTMSECRGVLSILDISDPSNLDELATYETPEPYTGVYVAGHHAYLAYLIPGCGWWMSPTPPHPWKSGPTAYLDLPAVFMLSTTFPVDQGSATRTWLARVLVCGLQTSRSPACRQR